MKNRSDNVKRRDEYLRLIVLSNSNKTDRPIIIIEWQKSLEGALHVFIVRGLIGDKWKGHFKMRIYSYIYGYHPTDSYHNGVGKMWAGKKKVLPSNLETLSTITRCSWANHGWCSRTQSPLWFWNPKTVRKFSCPLTKYVLKKRLVWAWKENALFTEQVNS